MRSGFAGAWFDREEQPDRGSLSRATLALRQRVALRPAKLPPLMSKCGLPVVAQPMHHVASIPAK
jgi:hypothetical protein